ncbi:hypothetical protein DFJ63DRAFT_333988 [Scheffersomyces coipomensis]|uniref:uncharacterized protein n=1 Tax=Scheffersomyces coipomensis TaxID=1788519 RepID=UPI00315CC9F0
MSSIATPITKSTKLSNLINYRLRIISKDSRNNRNYIGTLLAFDNHLNLVLSDVEEIRITNKSLQQLRSANPSGDSDGKSNVTYDKRSLGLIILRGEQIVSLSIESPPSTDLKSRLGLNRGAKLKKGKGVIKPLKTPVSVKSKVAASTTTNKGTISK